MQPIIDTHIHVWNFDKAAYGWLHGNTSILARTYHLHEIEDARKDAGIAGGVLVQSANNFEDTDWMLEVAETADWINGVVGWLPLMNPSETEKAWREKYSRNRYFKGVRHLIHDEADPRWLWQEPVMESLQFLADHNLTFDVVGVLPEHIETVLKVAEKIPALKMVFDHLNHPPIVKGERSGRWGDLMKDAAKLPNYYAKISGLGTVTKKAEWSADDIKPCVQFALEQFGIDRCFCGGDWPVSLLAGDYKSTWTKYRELLTELLAETDREKVFTKNATAFYRL